MKERPPFRPCGECDACCVTHRVGAIDKPKDCRCPHALGKGCSIYEQRPPDCRVFDCGWRQGFVGTDERDRPDRSGIVIDVGERDGGRAPVLVAHEVEAGASYRGRAATLIERLSRRIGVLVVGPGVGPRLVERGVSRPVNPARLYDIKPPS